MRNLPRAVLKDPHIELQQEAHRNTQIRYLYRDVSNTKVEKMNALLPAFTQEQIAGSWTAAIWANTSSVAGRPAGAEIRQV